MPSIFGLRLNGTWPTPRYELLSGTQGGGIRLIGDPLALRTPYKPAAKAADDGSQDWKKNNCQTFFHSSSD
ncbi:hypothetical protein BaRGS_00037596 [Batillaria attramentaria]|uniref:Uncharacterized protein n=1 Tax=Batillaria attramentaria TaxID=370345 RepID=A0ABD0J8E8_9CAEN